MLFLSFKCSYLQSFSSGTCPEESSEWRAQEKEWLFVEKKQTIFVGNNAIYKKNVIAVEYLSFCHETALDANYWKIYRFK